MSDLTKITCPTCGKQMVEGYIYSPDQIMWATDRKKKLTVMGDEKLVGRSIFSMKKVRAVRCTACQYVLFEYGKLT